MSFVVDNKIQIIIYFKIKKSFVYFSASNIKLNQSLFSIFSHFQFSILSTSSLDTQHWPVCHKKKRKKRIFSYRFLPSFQLLNGYDDCM